MSLQNDVMFSPFSPYTVAEEHNRSLLLQFILHELFNIHGLLQEGCPYQCLSSAETRHYPYTWGIESGPLNKLREYASLLPRAFPKCPRITAALIKSVDRLIGSVAKQKTLSPKEYLVELYRMMEKLFSVCEEDENLLFFLLKHQQEIDTLMGPHALRTYLLQIYPTGLRSLEEMISDQYHKRGFFLLIPELKELIAGLGLND